MKRLCLLVILVLGGFFPLVGQEVHVVSSGETLFSIARDHKVSVDSLKIWNQLKTNVIYVGQRLTIFLPVQQLDTLNASLSPQRSSVASPSSGERIYTVEEGDSLGLVAQQHKVSVNQLTAWNNLISTDLRPGQVLVVSERHYLQPYTVKPGDTLYSIAREHPVTFSELLALNNLSEATVLKAGQTLRVEKPKETQHWHYVRTGDTLESIASLYGVSARGLRDLNQITGRVSEGSLLKVHQRDSAPAPRLVDAKVKVSPEPSQMESVASASETSTHTVGAGDTLYNIARHYEVLIDDLKVLNNLKGNAIHKGDILTLPAKTRQSTQVVKTASPSSHISPLPAAPSAGSLPSRAEVDSNKPVKSSPPSVDTRESRMGSFKSLVVLDSKIPLYEWNGDYYYWKHPDLMRQPSRMYFEQWNSPLDTYRKGTQLLNALDKLVEARPKKSQALKGKIIILDPGHGGLDPGAIVKSKDGNGKDIYITEDEYVYDIALRMYVLLKDHGAQVKLTLLAPDHLIRDTSPASNTLINMKNEVYNLESLNTNDTKDSWPDGSVKGLARRIEVVKSLAHGVSAENGIFISLHADNQPAMPRSTGILYQNNAEMNDGYSQKAAEDMQAVMGGAGRVYVKGQDLFVLRNNPVKYKLLVELRNVASVEESWALRFADMRQDDAEKVVKGILAFFNS